MTVALDSNVFIAFLARDADFFEPARDLLQKVADSALEGVYSSLVFGEVMRPASSDSLKTVEQFFNDLGGTDHPANRTICIKAAELRKTHPGLKLPDAIHLATALAVRADCFVSADRQLVGIAKREMTATYLKEFRST